MGLGVQQAAECGHVYITVLTHSIKVALTCPASTEQGKNPDCRDANPQAGQCGGTPLPVTPWCTVPARRGEPSVWLVAAAQKSEHPGLGSFQHLYKLI